MAPERCAQKYADDLRLALGERGDGTPQFPLIILGLGEDGHTGSLFPGTDILFENDKLVRVAKETKEHPHDRLTFTPRLINAAQHVWFQITGNAKANATAKLYERSSPAVELPALIVEPTLTDITYFADAAAATAIRRSA
jgi:6-phosphogluconolactonase